MAVVHEPMAVRAAREVLAVQKVKATRQDALLYSAMTWTGIGTAGIGLTWIAGLSPGLRPYGPLGAVLGVILACAALGLAVASARRQVALRRVAAALAGTVFTAGAALIIWSTSNITGAVTYVFVAGLHTLWALRSD
jgi:hypothetical protein